VRYSTEFIGELKVLLGMDCIVRDEELVSESESEDAVLADEVVALEVNQRTLFDS